MPETAHELRAAFRAESAELCWHGARTACWLGVTLVPLFAVLDRIAFPAQAGLFLVLRLGCLAILAPILGLLHRPFGRRHALGLGVVISISIGLMIDAMTMVTGAEASPYYAGVNLVLLAVALLMPWPPRWSSFTSAVVLAGYVAPIVARGHVAEPRMLVTNLFFLVTTALIAVVSTALSGRLRWREFIHRSALVEALHHKSDFMARMSHELRTPLHVMIGYADILLEEALDGDGAGARRLVEGLRLQGVQLHRLISELLDYAKVEAGKMELHAEPVGVRELVEQVADRFKPLTERKGLHLETLYPEELPELLSDRQRLEQILINLVGNAVKFTERGSVVIAVRPALPDDGTAFTDITLAGEDARPDALGPSLAILVADTGMGIREEDVVRLAADFEQIDEAAAAKYGGTGLGLSISRRLAARLGGRIAVRSRYAEGSTFALFLPLAA